MSIARRTLRRSDTGGLVAVAESKDHRTSRLWPFAGKCGPMPHVSAGWRCRLVPVHGCLSYSVVAAKTAVDGSGSAAVTIGAGDARLREGERSDRGGYGADTTAGAWCLTSLDGVAWSCWVPLTTTRLRPCALAR